MILWTGFFLARVIHHGSSGAAAATLESFGMNWMGILFLLFVSFLAVDLITVFGFFLPRLTPSFRGVALITGLALSVIALVQGFRPPIIENYDVRLPGLSHEMDGTVIVAMSDLHIGSLLGEQWLTERVAQVMNERSDMVVLLGDLFEGHGRPHKDLLTVLSKLAAPLGVWAVPGNHEFHGGSDGNITVLDKTGICLLRDRWAEVQPGFVVAGVDDLTSSRRRGRNDDHISKALAGRPPGTTILLSHTPWQVERAASAGVDLMLSGHTHSGQIWPFGYVVRIFYPLLAGQYEVAGMPIIVCRGTGTWGPRMRLWRRGEILRVTLRKK